MMTFRGTLQERLERDCIPEPNSGCWLWFGATQRGGYGNLIWKGVIQKAHRLSWEAYRGQIPNDLHVLHRCDNPPCINPDHLFLGTPADNGRDRDQKGRTVYLRGEDHGCRKLTEQQVTAIRASTQTGMYLAKQYGVSGSAIGRIRAYRNWKHI